MRYLKLEYNSGKYCLMTGLGCGIETRLSYHPKNKESLRKLALAYREEGVKIVNGNLDERLFDYISGKKDK